MFGSMRRLTVAMCHNRMDRRIPAVDFDLPAALNQHKGDSASCPHIMFEGASHRHHLHQLPSICEQDIEPETSALQVVMLRASV
eukprot:5538629-Prymnesium_polylepis.1